MLPRLYLPAATADCQFHLTAAQSRHLLKVLRLKKGGELTVFDGAGGAYNARITDEDKHGAIIETTAALPAQAADGGRKIHIGQVVCAPAKMDWAVEKMTELGAASITPLLADNDKRQIGKQQIDRWRRLTIAACGQCGRNVLPLLHPAQKIAAWQPTEHCILLTPRAEKSLLAVAAALAPESAITLAVGGEPGFSQKEEKRLIAAGFKPAHLGARILRTETAALAALSLLQLALAG